MSYKVLIVVKDQWCSDQRNLPTFAAAKQHQKSVAAKWNDCETAICAPDNRVLNYQESLQFRTELAMLRHHDLASA